jgi:hypothetical protein
MLLNVLCFSVPYPELVPKLHKDLVSLFRVLKVTKLLEHLYIS